MNKNLALFKAYIIAGSFTFSGGMAMLPVIERELCNKHQYLSREDLYEYTTLSQTFPGVIALTNACFIGRKLNGIQGMLIAGFAAIMPAFVLMIIATILFYMIPQTGIINNVLTAIRACSTAFLFTAAYSIARYNLANFYYIAIAFICFILTVFKVVNAPILIIISSMIGVLIAFKNRGLK
ncbi:chromate transporter [Mycoplasma sp. P36-A1]|uniref:chromate transporter n=1 Tax=Mycoplasma sp. P36-A1 TaxID=3252900 RepID=UPI003C2F0B73